MRADRLLSILILLQSRGMQSAGQLASELEVSERTIYRDMDALSMAGFPVYANTGKGGGFALLEGYSPELSGFTTRDIRALSSLNIPNSLDEIGLGDALRHALLKLIASTGHDAESDNHWLYQRFMMVQPAPKTRSKNKSLLSILQKAVWEDRWIQTRLLFFTRPGYTEPVRIAPYTLIAYEQRWYVLGARRDFLRVYPIEILVDVELLEENFIRPANYTPEPVWANWRTSQQSFLQGYQVTVWLKNDLLYWLERTRRWPLNIIESAEGAAGWSLVQIAFDNLGNARTNLLGFGNGVKIVSPEALRLSAIDYANEFLRENRNEK